MPNTFRLFPLVFWLLSLPLLDGCGFVTFARVTINDPISVADVAFIVPGQTTFAEVVQRLGAPDELVGSDDGAVIFYHFRDAKYSRINLSWPAQVVWSSFVPDFILSGAGLGSDVFQVSFDRQWIVQHHEFARHVRASRYRPWPF